jgi:protein-S-isoprenylcysteine O-methyltransferase Ste14
MSVALAKAIWVAWLIAWFLVRYPHARRARRNRIVHDRKGLREITLMMISATGLFLVPVTWVASGFPGLADYAVVPAQAWAGVIVFLLALWLFHVTHSQLGRNWSITLKVREDHKLVTHGVYRYVRHPMYAAFWLWAIGQCLLLPNWIAGPAGLVGFGTLFFGRVGREEELMIESFGEEYRNYMRHTARVLPWIY